MTDRAISNITLSILVLVLVLLVYIALQLRHRRASREPMTPDGKYDAGPAMVANITGVTWMTIVCLSVGVVAGIIAKAIYSDLPDYVPMILPALTMIAGQVMGERKAIIAYLYDGSPTTNETNATNAKIVAKQPAAVPRNPDVPLKVDVVGTPDNPPDEVKP